MWVVAAREVNSNFKKIQTLTWPNINHLRKNLLRDLAQFVAASEETRRSLTIQMIKVYCLRKEKEKKIKRKKKKMRWKKKKREKKLKNLIQTTKSQALRLN